MRMFYPDRREKSAYTIDYADLYRKGYRGVIFDIDNTLVPHGAPATKEAAAFFASLRETGFSTCLLSNNQKPRVAPFADAVGSIYIENAHKPSVKNYQEACRRMGDQRGAGGLCRGSAFSPMCTVQNGRTFTIF